MKSVRLFLALFVVLILAFPAVGLAGGYYKEVKCDICGKLLREWVETSDHDYILTNDIDPGFYLTVPSNNIAWSVTTKPDAPKELDKAKCFAWSQSLTLCPECKKKYAEQLEGLLLTTWDKFLAEAIEENRERAKLMQEEAKEYRIQALRKELSDFEKEIKERLEEINKIKEETE